MNGTASMMRALGTLWIAGWAYGCGELQTTPQPAQVMPTPTRPPTRTSAGLFIVDGQPIPDFDPCRPIVSRRADVIAPDGSVYDTTGDGIATVTLVVRFGDPCPSEGAEPIPEEELIWLEEDRVVATGARDSVDLAVGAHRITLTREIEGDRETVRNLDIQVIGATTPTAQFNLESAVNSEYAEIDYDCGTIRPLRSDGLVRLDLDGAGSTAGPLSTIEEYTWGVDGLVVGTGPTLTVELPIGTHTVQLLVENRDGESHLFEVAQIMVDPVECEW